MLDVKDVSFAIGNKWLISNFTFQFCPGKCYMLCGPNGAGKSTLLKLLSLQLKPGKGEILYDGRKINYNKKQFYAKSRAVFSQQVDISFAIDVEDVIMMGRYPHFEGNPSKKDKEICEEIITLHHLENFRKRNFLTLSGGEKQRVQFARVMAQVWEMPENGNRILLLDEPISALDIKYQFDFLKMVKQFQNSNTVVIAILHDLNLCLNYADEILLLNEGSLFAAGEPVTVLSESNIKDVFHVDFNVFSVDGLMWAWPK